MDVKKLVLLVAQCPPLWDRNHDKFRDQGFKAAIWNKIGTELSTTDTACRETFKALREKYIREREKLQQCSSSGKQWELLEYMQFLDPHIIARRGGSTTLHKFEEFIAVKQDPTAVAEYNAQEDIDINAYTGTDYTNRDFCKALIKMVFQSRALWDRNCKDYNDKQIKDHLWMGIANTLNADVITCALKWKSLREKYIRQKQKHCDGERKWEFLDDLSFLDNVILYRKKQAKTEDTNNIYATSENSCALSQSNSDYEPVDDCTNDSMLNQLAVTSHTKKQTAPSTLLPLTPDSTLEIVNKTERKRTLSNSSEDMSCRNTKKVFSNQERTPEQIFGEFVTAVLITKPDNQRRIAMMEIMSILTKPNS